MRHRKSVAAVLGLLTLLALGWYVLLRPSGSRRSELSDSLVPSEDPAVEGAPSTTVVQPPERRTRSPSQDAAGADESPRTSADATPQVDDTPSPRELVIEGTVTVVDPSGDEHPFESGSISLTVWNGKRGRREGLDVESGRWTATVSSPLPFSLDDLILRGRATVIEQPTERMRPPESGLVAVRARWPPTTILHVRSAVSHAELEEVTVVGDLPWEDETQPPGHYSSGNLLLSRAPSPIDLSSLPERADRLRRLTLHVRAPRHAWGHIDVDLDLGGDRFVDLVPEGGLEVTVLGTTPSDAYVRLRDAESRHRSVVLDSPLRGAQELSFDGLVPGRRRASIEVGEWFHDPVSLGETVVEIVEGETARAIIRVTPIPLLEQASLRGTLLVHGDWEIERPCLWLRSVGTPIDGRAILDYLCDLDPVGDRPGTWSFDFGSIPVGRYAFELDDPSYIVRIDHEPGVEQPIVVPAPAIASIRTIDKKGVEIPDVDELEWYPVLPTDGGSAPSVSVKRDPSTGRFEIRAPAGRIFVEASDSTFRGGKRFELSAGRELFDLRLTRLYSFVVAIRYGSARLPWEGDVPTAKCVDGGGYPSGWSRYDGKLEIVVTRPGRYTFSVPTVAGYLPVPDQEVTVLPDATVEHVIELVRER